MLVRIQLLGERIQCGHCHAECDTYGVEKKQGPLARFAAVERRLPSLPRWTNATGSGFSWTDQ